MTSRGWEELLVASRTTAEEAARATALRRQAGEYLWAGAKALIEEWDSDIDPEGDSLYASALDAIGKARKSAASKIRTVALATRDLDLHVQCYGSLNEAYRNARRLAEVLPDDQP
jgi:hypothetical protein